MFYYGIIISKPKSGKQYLRAIISYIKRVIVTQSVGFFILRHFLFQINSPNKKKLSYQYQ